MKTKWLLLGVLLALCPMSIWAWGQKGHRVIANVTNMYLTQSARSQINQILGFNGIVYSSTWADEIKSDTIYPNSSSWHYQDIPAGLTDTEVNDMLTHHPTENGRLLAVLDSMVSVLKTNPTHADALRFTIHLVSDMFCPMHIAHPDDKGGGMVMMKWHESFSNLHAVWDDGLIESRGYSYSEYTEYLNSRYYHKVREFQSESMANAFVRTYHLTCQIYDYQQRYKGNAYQYAYHFTPDMEQSLFTAGIQLATLLNSIYR